MILPETCEGKGKGKKVATLTALADPQRRQEAKEMYHNSRSPVRLLAKLSLNGPRQGPSLVGDIGNKAQEKSKGVRANMPVEG